MSVMSSSWREYAEKERSSSLKRRWKAHASCPPLPVIKKSMLLPPSGSAQHFIIEGGGDCRLISL